MHRGVAGVGVGRRGSGWVRVNGVISRGGTLSQAGAVVRDAYIMVNTSCAVFRCGSSSHRNKGVKFHQFPRDERALLWIEACKRPDLIIKDVEQLKYMHICSLHFEDRMYGKQLLKKSAVPTLNLPSTATHTTCTQTEISAPVTLHVSTSQGVQTDDELIMTLTKAAMAREMANIPSILQARKRFHRVYGTDRRAKFRIGLNADITIEQFVNGCDAFLPAFVSSYVKAHVMM